MAVKNHKMNTRIGSYDDWDFQQSDLAVTDRLLATERIDTGDDRMILFAMLYSALSARQNYQNLITQTEELLGFAYASEMHLWRNPRFKNVVVKGGLQSQRLPVVRKILEWTSNVGYDELRNRKKNQSYAEFHGWLCESDNGLGPKTGALFLRMFGYSDAVPIDRWTLEYLKTRHHVKLDEKYVRGLNLTEFKDLERILRSAATDVPPGILQARIYTKGAIIRAGKQEYVGRIQFSHAQEPKNI